MVANLEYQLNCAHTVIKKQNIIIRSLKQLQHYINRIGLLHERFIRN